MQGIKESDEVKVFNPLYPENQSSITQIEKTTKDLMEKTWPLLFQEPIPSKFRIRISPTLQIPRLICRQHFTFYFFYALEAEVKSSLEKVGLNFRSLIQCKIYPLLIQQRNRFTSCINLALLNREDKKSSTELLRKQTHSMVTLMFCICRCWKKIAPLFPSQFLEATLIRVQQQFKSSYNEQTCKKVLSLFEKRVSHLAMSLPLPSETFPPQLIQVSLIQSCSSIFHDSISALLVNLACDHWEEKMNASLKKMTAQLTPLLNKVSPLASLLQTLSQQIKKILKCIQNPKEKLSTPDTFLSIKKVSSQFLYTFVKQIVRNANCAKTGLSTANIKITYLLKIHPELYSGKHTYLLKQLQDIGICGVTLTNTRYSKAIKKLTKAQDIETEFPQKHIGQLIHAIESQLLKEYFSIYSLSLSQQFLCEYPPRHVGDLIHFRSIFSTKLEELKQKKFCSNLINDLLAQTLKEAKEVKGSFPSLFPKEKSLAMYDAGGQPFYLKPHTEEASKKSLYQTLPLDKEKYPPIDPEVIPPHLELKQEKGAIGSISWGASFAQGGRDYMEDNFLVSKTPHTPLLAVMDGHGGETTSKFLQSMLSKSVQIWFGLALKEIALNKDLSPIQKKQIVKNAMKCCCLDLNLLLFCSLENSRKNVGSTLIFTVIYEKTLIFVNTGDSRAILVDSNRSILQLSEDADPIKERFQKKIIARNGHVKNSRVEGYLATARSFGDFHLKSVSACPKILCYDLEEKPVRVILGSDGIYDLISSEEVGKIAQKGKSVDEASSLLIKEANSRAGHDNMIALVFDIKSPRDLSS